MKRALKVNESNSGYYGEYDTVKIFEIGNVFTSEGEYTRVCIGVHPLAQKKRSERASALLLLAKDALQKALGIQADCQIDENTLEFSLKKELLVSVPASPSVPIAEGSIRYQPLSPYPFMLRDIALWTPEGTSSDAVKNVIIEQAGPLCIRSDQFDTFTKEGKTSYAFHLVFQSFEKTLTDEEVGALMKKIESALVLKGYTIR
jgi:phenylalanyl-tRNA synthetase beta subunit